LGRCLGSRRAGAGAARVAGVARVLSVAGVALAVALAALVAAPRTASAQEKPESVAMEANRGLQIGVAPALVLPLRGDGPWGGGLVLDGRYGIQAGPTVIAPGGRLSGYIISSRGVGMATPTLRVTFPVGPLAPFALGGVGPGGLTNPGEAGLAVLGGAGLMIHVGRIVAFGAEATYETITDTEFHTFAIGPMIALGG
jgi:hypothetical protein